MNTINNWRQKKTSIIFLCAGIGINSEPGGSDAAGLAREEDAGVRMEEGEASHVEARGVYEEQMVLEAEHGNNGNSDVTTKAKAFVAKHKEELSGRIRASFADQLPTYTAIGS